MDNHLEDFVYKNKEAFDVHEPSPNVWKTINRDIKKNKIKPLKLLKYAAAIIIFTAGFAIGSFQNKIFNSEKLAVFNKQIFEEQSQIIESEYYYVSEINNKMAELKPFFASDPQLKHDIEIDFEELDIFYNQLKTDLDDNINNDQVIEAMVHSYQVKLSILETLLQQLKQYDNEEIKRDV